MRFVAILLVFFSCAHAALAAERSIQKEVVVKAPIEAVWKAWTTSEGITSFFAPEAVVEPRPGGAFAIYMNPYAPPGLKGADDMRVLAVQAPKMLSFTWNAPPSLPEARAQRTYVTVRLQPAGEGETRVTLFHGGWGDGGQWDQAYEYFDKAWSSVLEALGKRFVEGPRDWAAFRARMKTYQDEQDKKKQ
jgi:uncharacterized protein YndB with AHSA1/START domain